MNCLTRHSVYLHSSTDKVLIIKASTNLCVCCLRQLDNNARIITNVYSLDGLVNILLRSSR